MSTNISLQVLVPKLRNHLVRFSERELTKPLMTQLHTPVCNETVVQTFRNVYARLCTCLWCLRGQEIDTSPHKSVVYRFIVIFIGHIKVLTNCVFIVRYDLSLIIYDDMYNVC